MATGRDSLGSLCNIDEHFMLRTLRSLEAQTFKDFEFIVVDALKNFRDIESEIKELGTWSFPIRVLHPNSWWWEMGMWSLQNSFNVGARESVGEHLLFCGDCFEIDPHILEESAKLLRQGLSPSLLYVYRVGGNIQMLDDWTRDSGLRTVADAIDAGLWSGKTIKRDCRWQNVLPKQYMPPSECPWTWLFGYCFISREDFYHVNGWDENFDGEKALGDVELGSRLQMAGRWKLCIREDLFVYENYHYGISEKLFHKFNNHTLRSIRCNYDLILWHRSQGIWKGNDTAIPVDVSKRICRGEISGHMGWPDYKFDDSYPEFLYQKHWMDNPAIFKL